MSYLFQSDKVNLICSCGLMKPITAVYFCRYCLKLRCGNCVPDEIDTMYCPHCLEVMPSTEARLKQNRCTSCFDCPCCGQTLSTRAASVRVPSTDTPDATFSKKVYYLGCTSCRWTTRDVGMPDQPTATVGWGEKEYSESKRIQDLMDYYLAVAQREKFEAEKKSKRKKRLVPLGAWNEKFSLSSSSASPASAYSSLHSRKSMVTSSPHVSLKGVAPPSLKRPSSEPLEDLPELSLEELTKPVDMNSVTNLEQRFRSPLFQPEDVADLIPLHKLIVAKRSYRCRVCEHNLSKPEYNSSSIKFKIQLGAYYHLPEIRILKEVPLKGGEKSQLQLTVCNPTPHAMIFSLLPFSTDPAELQPRFESEADKKVADEISLTSLSEELPQSNCSVIESAFQPTAEVCLPSSQISLAAKDETVEYGEADTADLYKNDPNVTALGRANKVAVNITVTPTVGAEEAVIGLLLRYEYTNTVATALSLRTVTLTVPVVIRCGKVSS